MLDKLSVIDNIVGANVSETEAQWYSKINVFKIDWEGYVEGNREEKHLIDTL